jgi:hypothetical protein
VGASLFKCHVQGIPWCKDVMDYIDLETFRADSGGELGRISAIYHSSKEAPVGDVDT